LQVGYPCFIQAALGWLTKQAVTNALKDVAARLASTLMLSGFLGQYPQPSVCRP